MIYEDNMTQEDAELMSTPAPKGKYLLEVTKVFKTVDENGEQTGVFIKEETGNRMYRLGMKIVEGPFKDGVNTDAKGINTGKQVKPYNAVWDTGLLAAFKRAFPETQLEGGKTDPDLAIGLQVYADLKVKTFEGIEGNEIAKLYPKNA